MAIIFLKDSKTISLHTKSSTYQMQIGKYGNLLHLYYGKRVEGDMDYLLSYRDRGFCGNPNEANEDKTYSLDVLPQEFPTEGTGDFRSTCLSIKNSDTSSASDLKYVKHSITKGKYQIPGLPAVYDDQGEAETLEVFLIDPASRIEIVLRYGVFEDKDIITRSVILKNAGDDACYIERIKSMCVDLLGGEYDWVTFYGRHAMEQNVQRTKVNHGVQSIGSKRGASSHQYNPFFILADRKTTEDAGDCYGFCFVYSGSFKAEIELDQYNQTRVIMGLQEEGFSYKLEPKEVFYSPEVIMSYSDAGLTTLSHQFHDIIHHNICRGKYKTIPRPVLINNWEATYFDFDGDKIYDLAKKASKLGVEMLVLDDGWFGKREDDFSGLGDWIVNEKKLGSSLKTLVDRINNLDMKFGLWFEPEMISEDSDLFRMHPDWAFVIPGRKPIRSRYQLVLDLSRKEVVDFIFQQISSVLNSANIEYIKWDFNRSITDIYSVTTKESQGTILYKYMLGLYDLLERLMQSYPNVLIESCSGGGGRFDAGMMHYSPQIWASDNTDAIDRISIQEGISFAYPISTVGSHVSAVPNHQTGRITPLDTRATVAMAGTFGYELDLNKISPEEEDKVKKQIKTYRQYWNLINNGRYYRLTNKLDHKDFAAWQFVFKDKSEALLNIVTLTTHGNALTYYVKLKGLTPDAHYRNSQTGVIYSGSALMYAGITIPYTTDEYQTIQIHFARIAERSYSVKKSD